MISIVIASIIGCTVGSFLGNLFFINSEVNFK